MKDRNKILFGLFFLFGILASLGFVSATVSIDLPAQGATLTGTFIINVTNQTGFDTMNNCTFTIGSSLTANTSVTIGTFDNDTLFNVNGTYDSTLLEDANDYILSASCVNSTSDIQLDTSTGLIVDNTIPQTPSSLTPSDASVDSDGDVTFSATVTGVNTTSCTLQFSGLLPPGGNAQSMTHTGNTCSLTLTAIPDQIYTWFIRASDETDTTDSSTIQINVDVQTSAGKTAALIDAGLIKSEGGATFSIIQGMGNLSSQQIVGGLIVIGLIMFFFFKKK